MNDVQTMLSRKGELVAELRALYLEHEGKSDAEVSPETRRQFKDLETELDRLTDSIEHGIEVAENNKRAAEQRRPYRHMLTNDPRRRANMESQDKRIVDFFRGEEGRSLDIDLRGTELHVAKHGLTETRDLTAGGAAGGATVPAGFVGQFFQHLIEEAGVRRTNATQLRTAGGEPLKLPKSTQHSTAVIVAENTTIPESDPAFGSVNLEAFKYGVLLEVTRELLQDADIRLESFLARTTGIAIGQAQGDHFVNGTGTGQPEGILTNATVGKTGATGQVNFFLAEDLIDLYHSVTSSYRGRGVWIMNDQTAADARKLRDESGGAGTGQFLWQPGLQADTPDRLLGRPVVIDPFMPTQAAGATPIAFGDFSAYYAIRDAGALRFERSDDFGFNRDVVAFRALLRTDAKQVINGTDAAVKVYQNAAA